MNRGAAAEGLAARFLASQGLAIVSRNYRCRGGEIDIVARDGSMLVFVEVRMRSSSSFGGPAESITFAKRRRIRLAAQHYLARWPSEPPCRFDAVLLDALKEERIEWLRGIDLD